MDRLSKVFARRNRGTLLPEYVSLNGTGEGLTSPKYDWGNDPPPADIDTEPELTLEPRQLDNLIRAYNNPDEHKPTTESRADKFRNCPETTDLKAFNERLSHFLLLVTVNLQSDCEKLQDVVEEAGSGLKFLAPLLKDLRRFNKEALGISRSYLEGNDKDVWMEVEDWAAVIGSLEAGNQLVNSWTYGIKATLTVRVKPGALNKLLERASAHGWYLQKLMEFLVALFRILIGYAPLSLPRSRYEAPVPVSIANHVKLKALIRGYWLDVSNPGWIFEKHDFITLSSGIDSLKIKVSPFQDRIFVTIMTAYPSLTDEDNHAILPDYTSPKGGFPVFDDYFAYLSEEMRYCMGTAAYISAAELGRRIFVEIEAGIIPEHQIKGGDSGADMTNLKENFMRAALGYGLEFWDKTIDRHILANSDDDSKIFYLMGLVNGESETIPGLERQIKYLELLLELVIKENGPMDPSISRIETKIERLKERTTEILKEIKQITQKSIDIKKEEISSPDIQNINDIKDQEGQFQEDQTQPQEDQTKLQEDPIQPSVSENESPPKAELKRTENTTGVGLVTSENIDPVDSGERVAENSVFLPSENVYLGSSKAMETTSPEVAAETVRRLRELGTPLIVRSLKTENTSHSRRRESGDREERVQTAGSTSRPKANIPNPVELPVPFARKPSPILRPPAPLNLRKASTQLTAPEAKSERTTQGRPKPLEAWETYTYGGHGLGLPPGSSGHGRPPVNSNINITNSTDLSTHSNCRPELTTALITAVGTGSIDMVKIYLDEGALINGVDPVTKLTPLTKAMDIADPINNEMPGFLLSRGADALQQNDLGDSPLLQALRSGSFTGLKALAKVLDLRQLPDGYDDLIGNYFAEWCTYASDQRPKLLRIIMLMIDEQICDLHWRDKEGKTALMKATEAGNINVVRMLLRNGAKY
ncbi:hypothetical protein ABW19_dt0201287 [Dactylella cylindrospora]|nr:hypothetical protein ABW19_dt0201287 [Dactylella cylindrospora]